MSFNQELTPEEKLEKAIAAAEILCKHKYRGFEFWIVERTITTRQIIGNAPKIIQASLDVGIEDKITVQSLTGINKFGWWEAVVIAEALEQQRLLP